MKENNALVAVNRHNESSIFSLLLFLPVNKTDYCILWHILIVCKYLNWFILICIVQFALRMHCGTETVLNVANIFCFLCNNFFIIPLYMRSVLERQEHKQTHKYNVEISLSSFRSFYFCCI